MRVLILGVSGFIGQHLQRRLILEGHEVTGVARRSPPDQAPGGSMIPLDLRDPAFTDLLPKRVDVLVHLAQAATSFPEGVADLYTVNTVSVLRALEFARTAGASFFLLASSGSVYGFEKKRAGYCEDDPCRPRDFYEVTKRHAEELVEQFAQFFPAAILRLFTPYGPGQSHRLVSRLIERIASRQPLAISEQETSPRLNPIFISDVVEAMCMSLRQRSRGTYNLGGPDVLSLREMAEIIGHKLGIPPVFQSPAPQRSPDCFGDISKIKREVGFAPSVRFSEGVRLTIGR